MKIAFIGLGWAAEKIWLPTLGRILPDGIYAGLDSKPSKTAIIKEHYPNFLSLKSFDEVIKFTPDLVLITSPNFLHATQASYFIERNVSVFIEKPVCVSYDEFNFLTQLYKKSNPNTGVYTSQPSIFRDDINLLKDIYLSKELGDIFFIELRWNRSRGIPGKHNWFTSKTYAGGGSALDLGWHLMEVLTYILGPFEFIQSMKRLRQDFSSNLEYTSSWKTQNDIAHITMDNICNVEDNALCYFEINNGINVLLHTSWASAEPYDKTTIVLHGVKGLVRLHTTFGFSPFREPSPRLEISTANSHEIINVCNKIGIEYERNMQATLKKVVNKDRGNFMEIEPIIHFYEKLYAN